MRHLGFGASAPADAALHVYDVGSASFQPTYSPMTAPPPFTTLPPDPSQTITNAPGGTPSGQSPGHSGTGTGGVSGSPSRSSTGYSTSSTRTSGGGGGGGGGDHGDGQGSNGGINSGKSHKAAIAIGSVLGAIGLTTGVVLTVWYFHRRQAQSGPPFSPLDDDEEHPHSITAVPMVGTHEKGPRILTVPLGLLSIVGLGRRQRYLNRSRHDILADEDRSFDWEVLGREGSGRGSGLGDHSGRSSPHGWSNAVASSLRNLARSTGRSSLSRESTSAANQEKHGNDPFSPEVALMADRLEHDELPERTGPSHPYTDPFVNPDSSSEVLQDYLSGPEPESQEDPLVRPTALRTLTPKGDFVPMSPLVEQTSQNSLSISSSSHNTSSDKHIGSGGSSNGTPRSPRPSSILDPNPPPSEPMRRSNSWWSRFAKTPLLERRSSDASTRNSGGFIDFRDPNPPPPRLLTIEESVHTHSPDISESRRMGSLGISAAQAHLGRRHPSLYRDMAHGKSASSLQTANTDTLERVGGTMDIVQRDGTLDSQLTSPNPFADDEFGAAGHGRNASAASSFGPNPLRALYVRGEPSYNSTRTESSSELPSPLPSPPPPASVADTPTRELADLTSEESVDSGHSPSVTERVRAFEQRMSRDNELPPSPTNTRRREERTAPRPVVRYGLVPRASLFVANPDGRRSESRGSDRS